MSDSFISAVEGAIKDTPEDKPWFKTKEGWAQYYDELGRSIPEDAGDILNILSDPEGVVRDVASFSKNELKSLSDLGAKGYAQRVAKSGSDFVSEAKEDPETAADITSQALLALALKGGRMVKQKRTKKELQKKFDEGDQNFVEVEDGWLEPTVLENVVDTTKRLGGSGSRAGLTFNDVGQREEPRLIDMIERNIAESQIDAVGKDRTLAPASRFFKGVDAAIQKNVGEPILKGLSNSPLRKGFQRSYEEAADSRISNEILSRLNTEKEKAGDRDKLRAYQQKYFPSAKLRNL